ncbi:MAG: long-chain fatty acid--CoA ligase [Spirochaetaceae bacterium]|nr:long-chain fatty acid--CoA ligase [Spirochaetaceae bacterium]|tara:strand:- start:56085 stop:57992 length:1908 start_codon:yes stop_codon:yes gene_type:complete
MNSDSTPKTFYGILELAASQQPDKETFKRRMPDGKIRGRTYRQLKELCDQLVAGLLQVGLKTGDRVLFLCDTSSYWLVTDAAITGAGAVSVPRGTDVTDEDISYIANHSEANFAIVQKKKDMERLKSMSDKIPTVKTIYYMEEDNLELASGSHTLGDLAEKGRVALSKDAALVSRTVGATDPKALATLIYTSGTTGEPKGVMLSQSGWIYAILTTLKRTGFKSDDVAVSLLPPWHAFERAAEYALAYKGMEFTVSDINVLREDLKEIRPTIFPSVPRIWESIYNGIIGKIKKESAGKQKVFNFFLSVGATWFKYRSILMNFDYQVKKRNFVLSFFYRFYALIVLILLSPLKALSMKIFAPIRQALGGRLRVSVSGGSALPGVVDRFLSAIGIMVLEGYGMTETSAVISSRTEQKPTPGTVGVPLAGYEIKLKDDTGKEVTSVPGAKGTLWVKSEQILMGYYKRPQLNDVVFDKDGFFDTGDLMTLNWRGELMFAGRAKDTIALAGGENIEPVPIEDKLLQSEFIDQVMVVGDDKKTLGAIIVPAYENVRGALGSDAPESTELWDASKPVRDLFRKEVTRLISKDTGFKSFEVIPGNCFYVSPRGFDQDTEMTRTLKMKRPVIKENFKQQIDELYT